MLLEKEQSRGGQIFTFRLSWPPLIFFTLHSSLITHHSSLSHSDELLKTYPNLKGFYWAKERLRDVYRARDKSEAAQALRPDHHEPEGF